MQQRLFAQYDGTVSSESLADLSLRLLDQQKTAWPQLAAGYAALAQVRVRELACSGFSVRLQFNPQRVVSSGARVDAQSIRARRCFLCLENLPEPQRGILYAGEFLLLCNPVPIFAQHYTISHLQHMPQAIDRHLPQFLALARELSPTFTVFYNGPKCGASAPDHLHFQACPTSAIPVEQEVTESGHRKLLKVREGVALFRLQGVGREVMVLEGRGEQEVAAALHRLIVVIQQLTAVAEEPMMNILCNHFDGIWRVILFPRRKHRPEVYFLSEAERVLISPASVDMGGLIITPIEKDFLSVEPGLVESIYQEVTIDHELAERLLAAW